MKKYKILWVVANKPNILRVNNQETLLTSGSWLIELPELLTKYNENLEIHIISPDNNTKINCKTHNEIIYHTVKTNIINKELFTTPFFKNKVKKIVTKIDPDIIHIQGSEFPFLSAFYNSKIPTILTIQGLVSKISRKNILMGDLSIKELGIFNYFVEFLKYIRNKFRSASEIKLIKKADHITGRTKWDEFNVKKINDESKYYFIEEILRRDFQENVWIGNNETSFILFAAGGYQSPLKGFHIILSALKDLIEKDYDVIIKVPGTDLLTNNNFGYKNYLRNYIYKNNLEANIVFLGNLSSKDMVEQYTNCDVMVLGSFLENSSNTALESLFLKTPSIIPYVGGIPSMLDDFNPMYYEKGNYIHLSSLIENYINNKSVNSLDYNYNSLNSTDIISKISKLYIELIEGN